jgi:hypothetical protein
VNFRRLNGSVASPRSRADLVKDASQQIIAIGKENVKFVDWTWNDPPNQVKPLIRKSAWGLPGDGLAVNRFSLGDDEALIVTIDPLGAEYTGFVLADLRLRSVNYWNRNGGLSNLDISSWGSRGAKQAVARREMEPDKIARGEMAKRNFSGCLVPRCDFRSFPFAP